jgi:hypothetical protein
MYRWGWWLWAGVACAFPADLLAQAAGPEFRVNAYTTAAQSAPEIASDGNGNFVVVWDSIVTSVFEDVFARRYTSAGVPLGPEFRVNTTTGNSQQSASVAATPTGEFVVVWESFFQDGSGMGVFAQRFAASGLTAGGEFRVNTHTTGYQSIARVATDPAGNFVVAWGGAGPGDTSGVFLRRYNASGTPLGGEFLVNTFTTSRQYPGSVAMDASGNFVVAWKDEGGQDGSSSAVVLRRFNSAGGPLAGEYVVNTYTTGAQFDPDVAYGGNGNFVVVWNSSGQDGNLGTIVGRLFDPAGTALTGEFVVNQYTNSYQGSPSVAMDARGSFTVTWRSSFQDGSDLGVYAREYDEAGSPLGAEFRVNTYTTDGQRVPAVASNLDGDFVVTWESFGQDGSYTGIYAQRYGDLIFQDDFETGALGWWSSANTDVFDLDASGPAAQAGTNVGLQAFVDDTNALFVQDDTPTAENRYRVRFYLDPNGFDPGEADLKRRVRVFIAFNGSSQRLVTVVLRRISGAYSLQARTRRDDGTRADTGFFSISNASHLVEFDWRRATAPGANNGWLVFYIDGVAVNTLVGLDNDSSPVEFARLGVMTIKTPAAGGSVLFDQFESRRVRYIGPEN